MLTTDARLKRACLAVLAGILASVVLPPLWAVFVGVAVFYGLLCVYAAARKPWQ